MAKDTYEVTPAEVDQPTVKLAVKDGETVIYQGRAYGDRATLQVPRGERDQVKGDVEEV